MPVSPASSVTIKLVGLFTETETVFPAGTVKTVPLKEKMNGVFPVFVTEKVP